MGMLSARPEDQERGGVLGESPCPPSRHLGVHCILGSPSGVWAELRKNLNLVHFGT